MAQKKLVRFAAIKTFNNVLEHPPHIKGEWHAHFKNANPIVLELACGKGEYAVGLGKMDATKNFIGVDIKGNRIYIGAKQAIEQGLNNVAFLRTQVDSINQYFTANEVSEIWITFPDPQLRKSRKRLTGPKFLRFYQQILVPGGRIHLKTDSPVLYDFTKLVIGMYNCILHKDYNDVYTQATEPELLNIKTHYEKLDIAQSGKIFYVQFSLPEVIPQKDEELKTMLSE
jgi:tRNA (guanine-N7-)-methyltransferase